MLLSLLCFTLLNDPLRSGALFSNFTIQLMPSNRLYCNIKTEHRVQARNTFAGYRDRKVRIIVQLIHNGGWGKLGQRGNVCDKIPLECYIYRCCIYKKYCIRYQYLFIEICQDKLDKPDITSTKR